MDRRETAFAVLKRRRLAGWTQHELAARAGVSVSSVRRVERATVVPDTATLSAIATALGVSLGDLVDASSTAA